MEQLAVRVANSGLAAYWCRWKCLVDLQIAAGGLTGSGAACCTGLRTVAWRLTNVGGEVW